MLALGVNDTLQASATTASTVNVVVKGALLTNGAPPAAASYPTLSSTGLQVPSSVGPLYGPGASNEALISSIFFYNTGVTNQTVALYSNGTAAADQFAVFVIPAGGWAQYEDGDVITVFNSSGLPLSTTSPVGTTNFAAYFSAPTTLASTPFLQFMAGVGAVFTGPSPWYDVKGNGITGNGSTDDSTAFTALLSTVSSAGGGVIFIGANVNINLASTTTFTIPGLTTIMGSTRSGSIIATPTGSTTNTLLQFAATDGYFTVRSIQFYSHATQTAGGCLNTNGASDVIVEDCEFNSGWWVDVTISGASIKVELEDCTFSNGVNAHVVINNGTAGDTYLTRCVFDGSGTCTNNILVNATGHYSLLQCNVTNAVNGMQVNPGAGQVVNDGFITHTLFDSCGQACLNLNASTSTSTIKGLHFVNSWFSGAGTVAGHTSATATGVITQGVAGGIIHHIVFDTCRILNNGLHGVLHQFGDSIWFESCWIAGNSNTASGSTANTGDGIQVTATAGSFFVTGCRIGGSDTSDTTSTQRWGVNVVTGNATITKYVIAYNDLTANGVSGTVTGGGPLTDNGPSNNITSSASTFLGKITGPNIGALGVGVLATSTTATAVATTEISVVSALVPFNSAQTGSILKITVWGTSTSTTTAGTCTLRVRFGTTTLTGTAILTLAPATVATAGTGMFTFECYVVVTALSATVGAVTADGIINLAAAEVIPAGGLTGATPANLGVSTATATLNTTVNNLIQATAVQTVGSMSLFGKIEVLNP